MGARGAEAEAQVQKLTAELGEYKAESRQLRNQDGVIRRLEERARGLEASLEAKVLAPALLLSAWNALPSRRRVYLPQAGTPKLCLLMACMHACMHGVSSFSHWAGAIDAMLDACIACALGLVTVPSGMQ